VPQNPFDDDISRFPQGVYTANGEIPDTLLVPRPRGTIVVGNDGCLYQSISDPPVPGYAKFGSGANGYIVYEPFAFNSASPLTIATIAPGQLVYSAQICIIVAFDDPAATLLLGTTSDPSKYFAANETRPTALGTYSSLVPVPATLAEDVILTIAPAASTTGVGAVVLDIRNT
jgi:hypothetical protein